MKICKMCPLFLNSMGGICNPKLYLNPETRDVSTIYKDGYGKGCGCLLLKKTKLPNSHCPNNKW